MSSCTKIPNTQDYKYIHPKYRQAYAEGKHWGDWKVGDQLIAVCRGDSSIKKCFTIDSISSFGYGDFCGTCLVKRSKNSPLGNIEGAGGFGIPRDEYEKYWFYVKPKEESLCSNTITFTSGVGTMDISCSKPERIEYEISPEGKNITVTITKQPESMKRHVPFKLSNGWKVCSINCPLFEASIETLYLIGSSGERDFFPMSPERYALFVEIVELFNKEYPKRNENKTGNILKKIKETFKKCFQSDENHLKEIESIICKAKGE